MNLRLACDNCGSQPCTCVEAECRACNGEGVIEHPHLQGAYGGSHAECPPDPVMVDCEDCSGAGSVKCDRGGVGCPFDHCYCEAAWDRQQEALASEPPLSADEQHQLAWRQKQELRR